MQNKEETLKSIKMLTFEQAMEKLEEITKNLGSGKETLEGAVNDYEIGMTLKKHCENLLNEAKLKIEKVIQNSDETITLEEIKLD